MEQYNVTGMSCAACQARVEKAVAKVPGVESVSVSLLTNSMGVTGSAKTEEVISAVCAAGYGASIKEESGKQKADTLKDTETPKLKRRLVLSVGFLLLLMYITMGTHMLGFPLPAGLKENHIALATVQLLLALAVMIINGKFFTSGFKSLIHGAPNMDTLVALGSAVSFLWSTFLLLRLCVMKSQGAECEELAALYHGELYFESAAMIPALITVGKLLEALSKGRTTDALKSLMELAPKTAVLIRDETETEVPIEDVRVGDIFRVWPGESIPVDGIVIKGSGAVDESMLSGESIPVDKNAGDSVSAATINKSGYLECRAERVGEDTTLAQIINMVSDAAATKAPIARIADQVSGIFVPAVILIALITICGWLMAGQSISFSLARGISVLVISCPCALGLATPVAVMVGNGLGAKNGILFKTGEALELAGKVHMMALDKTGTITMGEPVVTDLCPAEGVREEELLAMAYALEQKSEHPLAKAVVKEAQERGIALVQAEDFCNLPGNGLRARVDSKDIAGGKGDYIRTLVAVDAQTEAIEDELAVQGKTPILFQSDGKLLGMIAVADTLKDDSADAIKQLKNLGIFVLMLTGDNEKTAQAIAQTAGVDAVVSGVLPDGKERVVRALQSYGRVAMVGDGINDAPALTRADIGIAIGAGTDVAIESADVVLMNNSLADVAASIRLSRKTLTNIHENLFWAFFYNIICIPLAAGLFAWKMNPMIGAAAMSLSSFTVCMNALRLNLCRIRDTKRDRKLRGNITDKEEILNTIKEFQKKERKEKMTKTVKITGMMCGHCEATVKKAMEALPFVETAEVSHEKGEALLTLSGEMDEAAVKQAVEDKDFTFVGIA